MSFKVFGEWFGSEKVTENASYVDAKADALCPPTTAG